MEYKLQIRQINESDLNRTCPFIPEKEEYEMYVDALKEDIQALDVVVSIEQVSDFFVIQINSEKDFQILKSSVEQILSKQYYDKLRIH